MRKLAFLSVVSVVLVVAFVAHAQQRNPQDGSWGVGSKDTAVKIKGLLYIDDRNPNQNDGGAGISYSGRGVLVFDFAALTATAGAMNTVCQESSAGTANGCTFGDTVSLGVDQVLPNAFGTVNAYISAANAFKVRACAVGITDGGTFDIPDASYTVRCIR